MKKSYFITFLSVLVILTRLEAQVKATNEWVSFYGNSSQYQGGPIPVGAQINAYDPQGVLCGSFIVSKAGSYGFLAVYRDETLTSTVDEGAVPGDTIHFTINGTPALLLNPGVNVWTSNGAVIKAELTTNRAPVVIQPMKDIILNEDAPTYTVADLDVVFSDPDKDRLTFTVQSSVPEIQAIKDSENHLKLTILPDWNGTGQIIAIATDGILTTRDTVKVTIKPVNDAPILVHSIKNISLNEDAPPYIVTDLDSVFSDPDKDRLTFTVQSSVPEIQAAKDSENRLILTILPDWNGTGQVMAMATDGTLTARDTISVTIKPVYDAPFVGRTLPDLHIYEDASLLVAADLDTLFFDADRDILVYTVISDSSKLKVMITQDHHILILPQPNANGSTMLILKADDGHSTVEDTVLVMIVPVNDPPMISSLPDTFFINSTILEMNLNKYATDVEENPEALRWNVKLLQDKKDSVQIKLYPSNKVTFQTFYNFIGQIRVIFTVSDSSKSTDADTIFIRIDHPVSVEQTQNEALPVDYCLSPNYPNPFNAETAIRFGLPHDSDVELAVFNLMGQRVRAIVQNRFKAGWHILHWNGCDDIGRPSGSGIYLIQFLAKGNLRLQKALLVR